MTESKLPPEVAAPEVAVMVRGWALVAGLIVGAVVLLSAATFGWAGIAVIAAVLAGACGLLSRWARWPRPTRTT